MSKAAEGALSEYKDGIQALGLGSEEVILVRAVLMEGMEAEPRLEGVKRRVGREEMPDNVSRQLASEWRKRNRTIVGKGGCVKGKIFENGGNYGMLGRKR